MPKHGTTAWLCLVHNDNVNTYIATLKYWYDMVTFLINTMCPVCAALCAITECFNSLTSWCPLVHRTKKGRYMRIFENQLAAVVSNQCSWQDLRHRLVHNHIAEDTGIVKLIMTVWACWVIMVDFWEYQNDHMNINLLSKNRDSEHYIWIIKTTRARSQRAARFLQILVR